MLAANPEQVATYRGGKEGVLGFLVGQVMKETGGKADPKVVNRLLREKLRLGRSSSSSRLGALRIDGLKVANTQSSEEEAREDRDGRTRGERTEQEAGGERAERHAAERDRPRDAVDAAGKPVGRRRPCGSR